MNKVIYLPLEILEARYTKMMDALIVAEFKNQSVEYIKVEGEELTGEIESGAFLDACGTNYYKFSQLQQVMIMFRNGEIKSGDVFLVSDLWFPGIEAIKYTAKFLGIEIKITGVMHAGSWTDTDYVATMEGWAKWIEMGWFKMFDKVFVGSDFAKYQILNKGRCVENGKIIVTGTVWNSKYIRNYLEEDLVPTQDRDNVVVFPHRLDDEKQPYMFDYVSKKIDTATFIKAKEKKLSKVDYYKLLAKSKVMLAFSLQENFGQALFECIVYGVVPIVPNTLCYPEMVPAMFRYNSIDEAIEKVKLHLRAPIPCPTLYADKWNDSIPRIVSETSALLRR